MSNALDSARSLTHSPWAAVTARADSRPFYRLWRHQFWLSRITLSADLCRVKRSFKPHQNEHNSVKDTREKRQKKHVNLTWKFPWKSCFTTHLMFFSSNPKILKAFLKPFPTKLKPTKRPEREKNEARKAKKEGRRTKPKVKGKTTVSLLILLSVHAWTSRANILHQDQKAAKCSTCKRLCGKF